MQSHLHKKSILKKTAQVGISLLLSKFLGIAREVLQVKYLGVGAASDAFSIAYKIPNLLRKIFAEGALSAAFIPTLVKIVKDGDDNKQASKLMSLTLLFIGILVFFICLFIVLFAQQTILIFAPGFAHKTTECLLAASLVRVLIFFILFISSSALFAGAMQAKHHFGVPAWGPVLLNIIYIAGLGICSYYNIGPFYFSFFLLLGGFLQLILNIYMYLKLNFRFLWPDNETFKYFKQVMAKFLPCVFSLGVMEINLIIDASFASNLPAGSLTLINLASRFMGIALSTFAAAFSSILLSHFSRVSTYAPKRLSFYLLESAKLILWVTLPSIILMSFFSYDIFYTTFYRLTGEISLDQTYQAALLLIAFLSGLFFFSLNKLLLSIYYSMHETFLSTIVSFVGASFNIIFNWLLMPYFGALGLAISTSISAAIQSILFIYVLHKKFNFVVYGKNFIAFIVRYVAQLILASSLFYVIYKFCNWGITKFMSNYVDLLLHNVGLWLWVGPLCLAMFGFLYMLRKLFHIRLYFLD